MTTSLEKVKVYLINPGDIEQIWVGNNYFPEALKQQKAKFAGSISCTAALRNLFDGRHSPLSIKEIERKLIKEGDYQLASPNIKQPLCPEFKKYDSLVWRS